jgi:hypothetical protein
MRTLISHHFVDLRWFRVLSVVAGETSWPTSLCLYHLEHYGKRPTASETVLIQSTDSTVMRAALLILLLPSLCLGRVPFLESIVRWGRRLCIPKMKIVVGSMNATRYRDGSRYTGETDENEMACGQGIFVHPDSSFASGEWKDDWLHGKGISVDPDGNTFVGEFKDGKKHGKGVLTWRDGSVVRGEWKHGKVSCFAVCKYCSANGFEYSGEWKMGKMHGQGIMRFVEGTMYKGKFRNGYFCGHGVLTLSNGEEIEKECWTMDDLKNYYV